MFPFFGKKNPRVEDFLRRLDMLHDKLQALLDVIQTAVPSLAKLEAADYLKEHFTNWRKDLAMTAKMAKELKEHILEVPGLDDSNIGDYADEFRKLSYNAIEAMTETKYYFNLILIEDEHKVKSRELRADRVRDGIIK